MKKLKCGCLGFVCGSKFFVVKPCDSQGVAVGLVRYYKENMVVATKEEIDEASTYMKRAVASFVPDDKEDEWDYLNCEDEDDIEDWWSDEEPVFIPEDIVKKCHNCGQWLRFHTIPEGAFKTTATCTYCGVEGEYHIEAVA